VSNWNLKPGDKVVCISITSTPGRSWVNGDCPQLNKTYTVSKIGISDRGQVVISLLEHPRHPDSVRSGRWGFNVNRFRPVRTTSIDCFKVHLLQTPSPIKQKENVS